jgi:hypothetical protein
MSRSFGEPVEVRQLLLNSVQKQVRVLNEVSQNRHVVRALEEEEATEATVFAVTLLK